MKAFGEDVYIIHNNGTSGKFKWMESFELKWDSCLVTVCRCFHSKASHVNMNVLLYMYILSVISLDL